MQRQVKAGNVIWEGNDVVITLLSIEGDAIEVLITPSPELLPVPEVEYVDEV